MRDARLNKVVMLIVGVILSTATPRTQQRQEVAGERSSHWAFQPVVRPPVPAATTTIVNPIDSFIEDRLATNGLSLSLPATRTTLIRRLYLIMLGVPPAPEVVSAFVADPHPQAYARLVDRVLADHRYGERWARHWLDVIRFAESNGFETNHQRPNAWRFRDYVIEAFNTDMPYDQFVREQLAGDAIGADVATGFLVGGPKDIVSSPDPVLTAQQRADELDDMVSTTGATFLGLTVGCARCHAHKFDPVSQHEYYAMSAVFAGVRHGESNLPLPTATAAEIARINERIAKLEQQLAPFKAKPPAAPAANENLRPSVDFLQNQEVIAPIQANRVRFNIFATSGAEPCIDELEIWAGERNVALASCGTKATASGTLPGYAIHQLAHIHDGLLGNSQSWISNGVGGGWVQLEFAHPEQIDRIVWGRDRTGIVRDRLAVQYSIEASTGAGDWQEIASSASRTPFAGSSIATTEPMYRPGADQPSEGAKIESLLSERRAAKSQRAHLLQTSKAYAGQFLQPGPTHLLHRGDAMQPGEVVPPGTLTLFQPIGMSADTPEQQRRVQLANWITNPDHPLTARVLVNRVWQHQFGTGLVATPSDFGKNGSLPSHPQLLDWLASEFRDHGFSIKALQRLILTSAVWRQSSAPRAEAIQVDAASRLLWRFPPRRLEAEAIRDSILASSGQLDATAGGPSFSLHNVGSEYVRHYHPKEDFGPAEMRRMIYAMKVRTEPDLVFDAFDCPDGSLTMPRRGLSTTPLQSLNLWNSRLVLQQADAMAARLTREAGSDVKAQVKRAWQVAYQRPPDTIETGEATALVTAEGLPALCRALLNSNEFLFIP